MFTAIRALRGLGGRRAKAKQQPRRATRLQVEVLEGRRVLASSTGLPGIGGTVFQDQNNNNVADSGEALVGAMVRLFIDDGDGLFEPGTDDVQVGGDVLTVADDPLTPEDETGTYCFENLDPDETYFVQQPSQTVGGESLDSLVSPVLLPSTPTILIDDFSTTQSTSALPPAPNQDASSLGFADESEVIGQERDLAVALTTGSSEVRLRVNPFGLQDVLLFDSAAGSQGTRVITWDGVDNDGDTLAFNLGDRDLTGGGVNTGIMLRAGVDANGADARLRIYTNDAATVSEVSMAIPVTGGVAEGFIFLPFASFVGSADPTDVDAIELILDTGNTSVDGQIDVMGAIGPVTQDFANETIIDLELTKTVDGSVVRNGDTVTWTLTLTNNATNANASATDVNVTDVLPAGVTVQTATPSNGSFSNGVWTLADPLAPGATVTLNLATTVNADVLGGATLQNTAQVTAAVEQDFDSQVNNDDGDQSEDDESAAAVTIENLVDLELTKAADVSAVSAGDTVNFTVTVTNQSAGTNSSATNVTVSDPLPSGLTLVNSTATDGAFAAGVWTLADPLDPGETESLTLETTVNSGLAGGTTLANVAQVASLNETDIDSAPNNDDGDQSEDDEAMDAVTVNPIIDLELSKSINNGSPAAGENVVWTVVVSNNATNANTSATGVQVADVLPAGVTLVSASATDGTFSGSTWTLASPLAPGGSESLTITTTVDNNNAGGTTIINTAQVAAANEPDIDSAVANDDGDQSEDDEDVAQLTVDSQIDLELTKTVSTSAADSGDQVTWLLTVTNNVSNANADATSVQISDVLPTGLSLVSASPSGNGSFSGSTWSLIDPLAPGGSATLSIVTTVNNNVNGGDVIENVAQVSAANETDIDSTPGNDDGDQSEDDEDSALLTVNSVIDLNLTKTVDQTNVDIEDSVTWTITVENNAAIANTNATGVEVTDNLPSGVTFVSSATANGSYNNGSGVWALASPLAPGQSASLSIEASVDDDAAGSSVLNVAEVTAHNETDVDSAAANDDGDQSEDDEDNARINIGFVRPLSKRDLLASS